LKNPAMPEIHATRGSYSRPLRGSLRSPLSLISLGGPPGVDGDVGNQIGPKGTRP
jgi:hypothetical protein